ncbi:Myosin type-2 heavy chain 1 [Coemansia sp. RSA 720]|nr:Myosin type-2 heavy chain 1 [Coemansia sp. RSA 720]
MSKEHAAIQIQRTVRGYQARKQCKHELRLITRMQGRLRQRLAKRLVEKCKEEARSVAHFQEVTYQLEGKLMALTRQLDESQTRSAQLAEKLRQAHAESQQLRDAQSATIASATAELSARVEQLQKDKTASDERCAELEQNMTDAQTELEYVRSQASDDKAEQDFYYVDQAIMRQIMSELLCIIGVTAFNNIIMRRNFCSWKRGMQIQYNLTRIEEWCKAHSVSDTTRNLDRLLQLVKLLQLQKSTEQDIDIMFDVCDLLNPAQIKKLLSIYAVSDYENPIIGPVMNEVSRRASPTDKTDKMLLDSNDLSEQVLYLTARKVPAIETYIPPEFRTPRIRALVDSQTDMAYDEEDEEAMGEHMDEYNDYDAFNQGVPAGNY